jgi:hypothetical protein
MIAGAALLDGLRHSTMLKADTGPSGVSAPVSL